MSLPARPLRAFVEDELLPRLPLDAVYSHPAHKFTRGTDTWRGGCPWHDSKSGTSFSVTASSGLWYCAGCGVGGDAITYLWRLRGGNGAGPRGRDFVDTVKALCELAGVEFPERQLTPEEERRHRERETRRAFLDAFFARSAARLWSDEGARPRAYLAKRSITEATARDLGLGFGGPDAPDGLEGYIVFPWHDERGRALTAYGRYPADVPPAGRPKAPALPGIGTKASPLYLDRVRGEEVVHVEGPFDAVALRQAGEIRAVSQVAADIPKAQLEALRRRGVRVVYVCGDPDGAGEAGNERNARALLEAGFDARVVETLPDGLDPDQFVARDGIAAWRARVEAALPGRLYLARRAMGDLSPSSAPAVKSTRIGAALRIATAAPAAERALIVAEVATRAGLPVAALEAEAERVPSPTASSCTWRPMVDVLRAARPRTPISTGFPLLDSTFFGGGFSRGEAIALGGPPGSLKTTLEACLAAFMSGPSTYVGFAAFDEPEERVAAKIGSRFGEAFWRLNAEYPGVLESLEERLAIRDADIVFVDPLAAPAVEDILETFATQIPEGRTGVLFLDHLHAMTTRDASERDTEFDTIRKVASAVARDTRRLGIITVSVAEVLKAASSADAVRANPLGSFAGTRKIASLFTVPMVCLPAETGGMELILAKNRLGPRGSAILGLNPDTWALTVDSVRTAGKVGEAESRTATTARADDEVLRQFFADSAPVVWADAAAALRTLGIPKDRALDARRRLVTAGELEEGAGPRPEGSRRGPAPSVWASPEKLAETRRNSAESGQSGGILSPKETRRAGASVKKRAPSFAGRKDDSEASSDEDSLRRVSHPEAEPETPR